MTMDSAALRSELLAKIRLGEDSFVEFKEVQFAGEKLKGPDLELLADEIGAFANAQGGWVLLGVADRIVKDGARAVIGIASGNLDALEQRVRQLCLHAVQPPPPVLFHKIDLPDEQGEMKLVLALQIQRSLWVHKSPHGYFHRYGAQKQEMSPELLARLFQQRSQTRIIRFDEQPVPGLHFNDLTPQLWQRFVAGLNDEPRRALRKMNLLCAGAEADDDAVSVAGALFCSNEPRNYLAGAWLQAVCYDGTHPDAASQRDAREIAGPVDQQIWDALHFVERNMQTRAHKAPERSDRPQYSRRAVYEALVNAVAHRDYAMYGAKIRLFLFADRLELYSPGAIPNTMTIASLELRQFSRNELVTSLLARLPVPVAQTGEFRRQTMMDRRGEGVPIILRESYQLSGREPEYDLLDGNELKLTIWATAD